MTVAEIPQRLRHLGQPVPAVDGRGDLSGLAELHDRRQVPRTLPHDQQANGTGVATSATASTSGSPYRV